MPLNKILVSLLFIFFFISGEMKSQNYSLSGDYTIGSGRDYKDIQKAIEDLNSRTIDGPVKFIIDSGTYDGGFTIGSVSGVSPSDTILFISASENYNDVIINNQIDANDDYLVKLNGCQRVTFKNITFRTVSSFSSNQIILTGGSSNNIFENCVFDSKREVDCNALEAYQDGVVIHDEPSDSKEEFNQFINNKIIGGCVGISLEGKTGELEEGNEIIGNEFTDQKYKSVEVVNNYGGYFNDNTVIYKGNDTAVTLWVDSVYEVQGNSIYSGGKTALFIDTFNAKQPILIGFMGLSVLNNKISCPGGTALKGNHINGLFLGHNTLFNKTTKYTMYIDSVIHMLSVFNLLVNKESHGVFNITTEANPNIPIEQWPLRELGSDFNGVYSKDSTIGMVNGVLYPSLAGWQDDCPYGPDPNSSFGYIEFDNDTTGLELICGTSSSMRIKEKLLKDSTRILLVGLIGGGFFENKDINGKERNTSNFWKGQADIDVKINVNGYITNTVGNDTLRTGKVIVFAKRTNKNILEEIGNIDVSSNGYYTLDSLPYRDNYWLKIIPQHPNYVPSYHTKELRWDSGDEGPRPLSEFCNDTIIYNIFPKKIDDFPTGDYSISGNISRQKAGTTSKMLVTDPIPGLDVILDAIPPSRTIAITQTDSDGNYTFSNLPASDYYDPDGKYIVIIDYQGLPKDTLYEIELKGETDSIINLNYCVDTTEQIEGCAVPMVGMENLQFKDVQLYPNPLGETLTISGAGEKFDVRILDSRGRQIMNLVNQNENTLIPTVDLKSGLYFVVIKTSDGDSMYKVVK